SAVHCSPSDTSGAAFPAGYADGNHPQLLDGDPADVFQRLRTLRILDRLRDDDHRVDEERRQHVEVLGAPLVESREARQVRGQLGGDQPALGANGIAQYAEPAIALPANETPVLPSFGDTGDQDLDGRFDHPVRVELAGTRLAQGVAQASKRLIDQDQPKRLHRLEVTVERRRHNPDLTSHLAQAQAAEAAVLQQLECRGDDGAARRLLALFTRLAFPWALATRSACP